MTTMAEYPPARGRIRPGAEPQAGPKSLVGRSNDARNRTEQFLSETETEAVGSVENPGFRAHVTNHVFKHTIAAAHPRAAHVCTRTHTHKRRVSAETVQHPREGLRVHC